MRRTGTEHGEWSALREWAFRVQSDLVLQCVPRTVVLVENAAGNVNVTRKREPAFKGIIAA